MTSKIAVRLCPCRIFLFMSAAAGMAPDLKTVAEYVMMTKVYDSL